MVIKKLQSLAGKPFGECLYEYFKGQEVEIYLGEKSGSNVYFDYDLEQKVCVTGEITGAVGEMVIVNALVKKGSYKEVVVHSWSITGVSKLDKKIRLTHIFQEMKR